MMAPTYPSNAYVAVRGLQDGCWSAVVAVQGRVINKAVFTTRAEAFEAAELHATREGIPCLVGRAAA